jgi:hypothetical protein
MDKRGKESMDGRGKESMDGRGKESMDGRGKESMDKIGKAVPVPSVNPSPQLLYQHCHLKKLIRH